MLANWGVVMSATFLNMTTTGVVLTACGIVLLAWEILAFVFGKKRALISTWFQKLGFRAPAAVFVLGALAGHFWLYFPPTLDNESVKCPQCDAWLILNVDASTGELTASAVSHK